MLKHLYRTDEKDQHEILRVLRRAGLHPALMPWSPGGGSYRMGRLVRIGVPTSEHEEARRVLARYLDGRERAVGGVVQSLYLQIGVSGFVGLIAALWFGVATRGRMLELALLVFAAVSGATFVLGGLLARLAGWWRHR